MTDIDLDKQYDATDIEGLLTQIVGEASVTDFWHKYEPRDSEYHGVFDNNTARALVDKAMQRAQEIGLVKNTKPLTKEAGKVTDEQMQVCDLLLYSIVDGEQTPVLAAVLDQGTPYAHDVAVVCRIEDAGGGYNFYPAAILVTPEMFHRLTPPGEETVEVVETVPLHTAAGLAARLSALPKDTKVQISPDGNPLRDIVNLSYEIGSGQAVIETN